MSNRSRRIGEADETGGYRCSSCLLYVESLIERDLSKRSADTASMLYVITRFPEGDGDVIPGPFLISLEELHPPQLDEPRQRN